VLAQNKDTYISGLTAYREGRIETWLEMFAVAAGSAARLNSIYLSKVSELQEEWRISVQKSSRVRSDGAVWRLIDALPALPVVTLATAVIKVGRTKPAMNQALTSSLRRMFSFRSIVASETVRGKPAACWI
jgi:hypothetical protein